VAALRRLVPFDFRPLISGLGPPLDGLDS
jgi:hypothetical protein